MSEVVIIPASSFSQTSSNRTRQTATIELSEYTGGSDRPEVLARAGRAWDAAVREFNTVGWRFCRSTNNITLSSASKEYTLATDFRSQVRCQLLDANSNSVNCPLEWIPYEEWLVKFGDQTVGGVVPYRYTALNIHNLGTVRFDPYIVGTPTYPTAQITYLHRIALAPGFTDSLNVPMEVDEAIFMLAASKLVGRAKGQDEARGLRAEADMLRSACEREHRDWPDLGGWGANG